MCDQERMILMLLKALAINYPILKDWGYFFERLLVLQVTDGNRNVVRKSLINYSMVSITPDLRKNEIFKILENTNSEFVFFSFTRGTRGRITLDILNEAVLSGKNRAIPVVLTSVALPEEIAAGVIFISLTELSEVDYIPLEKVVPKEDELEEVKAIIEHYESSDKEPVQSLLYAAAAFSYPYFKRKKDISGFESFRFLAQKVLDMSDNRKSVDGIETWFLHDFFRKIDYLKIPMYDRELRFEGIAEDSLFYDNEYLYMSNKLFIKLCAELLSIYDLETIKSSLVAKGVLIPEYKGTFVYKMPFRNMLGEYKRQGMLRFQREKMKRFGELDIVEKFKIKGEGFHG